VPLATSIRLYIKSGTITGNTSLIDVEPANAMST
jgi:hypothetical protein